MGSRQVISSMMRGNNPSGAKLDAEIKEEYENSYDILEHPHIFVDKYQSHTWLIPDKYKTMDVAKELISRCETDEERDRVEYELDLFEQRDLIPLLQFLFYFVDHMRSNNLVWGVGRGSSVSSYVLYLIGVHKINSLKYNLSIDEFLK